MVPIFLSNAIMGLTASNLGKLERSVNVRVKMWSIEPFSGRAQLIASGIWSQRIQWLNQVSLWGRVRRHKVGYVMVLEPVPLINCIVLPIGWVADIELKEESSILSAWWVYWYRVLKGNLYEVPFSSLIWPNAMWDEDKEQRIAAPNDSHRQQMDGR